MQFVKLVNTENRKVNTMLQHALPSFNNARKTYKTVDNAKKALEKVVGKYESIVRYAILVDEASGRFYPVVFGMQFIGLAHAGIAVIAIQ